MRIRKRRESFFDWRFPDSRILLMMQTLFRRRAWLIIS